MSQLLLLSPTPTHPTTAGNRARVKALLELYEELGVDFHVGFVRHEPGDEQAMVARWGSRCSFIPFEAPLRAHSVGQRLRRRVARTLGKSLYLPYNSVDAWRSDQLMHSVRELAARVDPIAVQIEYVFFSYLFDCFRPSVFRILDTHDIVAERHRMFLEHGRQPQWFSTTEAEEARGVSRADCVLAIQANEEAYFSRLTAKPVKTVGHIIRVVPLSPPENAQPTVVFIGSANLVNADAYEFLVNEIWPHIRASVDGAVLEVYGGICASVPPPPGSGIVFRGEVADVSEAYRRACVVVCPLRFGTGLKIKSIEALGHGRALVSTTSGANGLEQGAGTAFLCGDSADAFSSQCIRVLQDAVLRSRLEKRAHRFAAEWNAHQREALLDVLALARLETPTQLGAGATTEG